MVYKKSIKIIIAMVAVIVFQGDQVSHAIKAYQPTAAHEHTAQTTAAPLSFAPPSLAREHFERTSHPCEDLGHSEENCPLANIADAFDLADGIKLSAQYLPPDFETAKNSLAFQQVKPKKQIRGPPAFLA